MESHVTIHLLGLELPAILSTSSSSASRGQPVLLMEGGPSFPEGELIAHGPADLSRYGVAASLLVTEAGDSPESPVQGPGKGERTLLDAWEALCAPLRAWGQIPTMAETFIAAFEDDPATEEGRSPERELDRMPLEREEVRHVSTYGTVSRGRAWRFPDGSGVVMVLGTWSVFGPDRRTLVGLLEHVGRLEWGPAALAH